MENTILTEDGYYVTEDGEIVGIKPAFVEREFDGDYASWVLEKINELDSDIAGLNARQASILENIATQKRHAEQRKNYLLFKYSQSLTEFAKENLPKGKKTWTCDYGSVKFTSKPARLKVSDESKAIAQARELEPEAVKVSESFLISKLSKGTQDMLMNDEVAAATWGLAIEPDSESVKIETGVK